jgi:hypothetical protein
VKPRTHHRKRPDMRRAQFEAACRQYGFEPVGPLGYFKLPSAPDRYVFVQRAGTRRRDQLTYLIEQDRLAAQAQVH